MCIIESPNIQAQLFDLLIARAEQNSPARKYTVRRSPAFFFFFHFFFLHLPPRCDTHKTHNHQQKGLTKTYNLNHKESFEKQIVYILKKKSYKRSLLYRRKAWLLFNFPCATHAQHDGRLSFIFLWIKREEEEEARVDCFPAMLLPLYSYWAISLMKSSVFLVLAV